MPEGSSLPRDISRVTDGEGLEIDFQRGGVGHEYLIAGWSHPDDRFTWTLGEESVVILPRPLPAPAFSLTLSGFPILRTDVPDIASFQRLGIAVNGVALATPILRGHFSLELFVPGSVVDAERVLTITLSLPDACAPSDFKPSGDHRKLGIGFHRLSLAPVPCAEPAPTATGGAPISDHDMLMEIQGLGANCELGFVQRHAKAEPLGLFRWASAPLPNLLAALDARFEGLGAPDSIEIFVDGADEFQIIDKKFGFRNHSFVFRNKGGTQESVFKREITRVPFLARLLIEELESAAKLFLYHDAGASPRQEIDRLLASIRRYGNNWLLWVVPAGHPQQIGTAQLIADGLICGYLGEFRPLGTVRTPEPESLQAWFSLIRQAHRIWRQHRPPAK